MELFTNQSNIFVEELLDSRIVSTNFSTMTSRPKYFKLAYDLLLSQLTPNIKEKFIDYPIWCWYKIDAAIPNEGIRIELDVPDDMVVLMDYYDWGGGALYYSKLYLDNLLLDSPSKDFMENIMVDIKNSLNADMFREDIQAIIPYIKLEWVTNLDEICMILDRKM